MLTEQQKMGNKICVNGLDYEVEPLCTIRPQSVSINRVSVLQNLDKIIVHMVIRFVRRPIMDFTLAGIYKTRLKIVMHPPFRVSF